MRLFAASPQQWLIFATDIYFLACVLSSLGCLPSNSFTEELSSQIMDEDSDPAPQMSRDDGLHTIETKTVSIP